MFVCDTRRGAKALRRPSAASPGDAWRRMTAKVGTLGRMVSPAVSVGVPVRTAGDAGSSGGAEEPAGAGGGAISGDGAGGGVQLRHSCSVKVESPAYLHAFGDALWLTQFGLRRSGNVVRVGRDRDTASLVNLMGVSGKRLQWPNSLTHVPEHTFPFTGGDAVIVCDGFLSPGAGDGGIYLLWNMQGGAEPQLLRLTAPRRGWFYHRAVLVGRKGGRYGVLAARGRKPLVGRGKGELVWLSMPAGACERGASGGVWDETVLSEGPDVMFDVVDMDPQDDRLEVFAAEFFGRRLTRHSIAIDAAGNAEVVAREVLDEHCGPAYGVHAVNLDSRHPHAVPSPFACVGANVDRAASHVLISSHEMIYDEELEDKGAAGDAPRGIVGSLRRSRAIRCVLSAVGRLLLGPEEQAMREREGGDLRGGSVFSYAFPEKDGGEWRRKVLASGFRVRGVSINPGAPGFVYPFFPRQRDEQLRRRPHLLLAGDCAQAAYVLAPCGDGMEDYEVLDVIKVGGAVGSLAVAYGQDVENALRAFSGDAPISEEGDDWARVVVPNYDGDELQLWRCSAEGDGAASAQ